ncbi:MAG: iron-containing alcohol dehydrogenase [Cellvibrionaceae bacterium]
MHPIHVLINRLMTSALKFVQRFLDFPSQMTFSGQGSTEQLCAHVSRLGHKKVLLITDKILVELGLADRVKAAIEAQQGELIIYDGVLPDPTATMVNDALALVKSECCDAIIAMGGGSSIDTAKGVAAAATHDGIESLVGILKLKRETLPLFAIPTTSGTGSEISIAAVISDPVTHQKGVMADPRIIPQAVALDATLLTGMPPSVTASTGIDALSHAVETFTGRWANASVRNYSGTAVKLIFQYLPRACENGNDLEAREALSLASYYAGLSLNTGSVGNVHALAHQLGGTYGIPHGVAIGAVMPHVLDIGVEKMQQPLAELARLVGVSKAGNSALQDAKLFNQSLVDLQRSVKMPVTLEAIKDEDIRSLAKEAVKEALAYPVRYFFSRAEAEALLKRLCV